MSFSPCISSAKNKIMSHPKELLKKYWKDPWDEKDNTRKKADTWWAGLQAWCTIFSHLFQLEVGTVSSFRTLLLSLYHCRKITSLVYSWDTCNNDLMQYCIPISNKHRTPNKCWGCLIRTQPYRPDILLNPSLFGTQCFIKKILYLWVKLLQNNHLHVFITDLRLTHASYLAIGIHGYVETF